MPSAQEQTKIVRIDGSTFNSRDKTLETGTLGSPTPGGYPNAWKYGPLSLNMMAEPSSKDKSKLRLVSRPRFTTLGNSFPSSQRVAGTNSVGYNIRHAAYWPKGGDTLYYYTASTGNGTIKRESTFNSTSLVTGLSTTNNTSGPLLSSGYINVGGTEFYDGTNYYYVISNGQERPYYINTSFTATQIADVDCPSGAGVSPYSVYMDGALFIAKDNAIHNSQFGNITDWPGYFRSKEQYPEPILALAKHKNSIVAFSSRSIEFFFNAGYSGTSPLNRQETYASRIGLARVYSNMGDLFKAVDDTIYFIGTGFGGSYGLYRIRNFHIEKVSPSWIDSLLNIHANNSISTGTQISLSMFKQHDNTFVILHFRSGMTPAIGSTADTTMSWVYQVEQDFWSLWNARTNSSAGTKSYNSSSAVASEYMNSVPLNQFIEIGSLFYGVHDYSADLIGLTPLDFSVNTALTDWTSSYPIDYCIRTPILDFGDRKQKHLKKMFFIDWNSSPTVTDPLASTYVFYNLYKDGSTAYPTALSSATLDDSMLQNLGTSRKFIIETQWTGGSARSLGGLEFHYNDGEQ